MRPSDRSNLALQFLSTFVIGSLAACSDSGSTSAVLSDAGALAVDASVDASTVQDAGTSTGSDASSLPDSSTDAGAPYATTVVARPLSVTGHDRLNNVAYDPQGRIVAVGQSCPGVAATDDCASVIVRMLADGTLDASFGTGGVVTKNFAVGTSGEVARGLAIVAGKIVVAAAGEQAGASDARERNVYLARFNDDGSIDSTFGTNGVATFDLAPGVLVGSTFKTDSVWGLAADATGRLYVSGAAVAPGRNDTDFAVLRTTVDGARDTSFGVNGVFTLDIANADGTGRALLVSPSGVVTACGYMTDASSNAIVPVVYRTTPAGVLDATFASAGVFAEAVLPAQAEAYALALQGDRFVTNGYGRAATSEELDFVSLRLSSAGALDTTFGTAGLVRIDANGFKDQGRALAVLADRRVLLVGAGRSTATNADGLLALLSENGGADTAFGLKGQRLVDLGGTNDTLNAVAVAPSGKRAVAVGTRAFVQPSADAGTDAGVVQGDDGALVLVSLP